MPVVRRDRSQFYQIEFKYRGVRYRRSSETDDRRLAEAIERKWRTEVVEGRSFKRVEPMTLQQAVDRYIATVVNPKAKVEAARRERWLIASMTRLLGPKTQLVDLTASRIAAMGDGLIKNRIINDVRAIDRVVDDATSKPPGTIGWE